MIHIILSLLSHNFSGHLLSNVQPGLHGGLEAFLWVSLLESTLLESRKKIFPEAGMFVSDHTKKHLI